MPFAISDLWFFVFRTDTDWRPHLGRMRRRLNGKWQYRDMTPEEQDEWVRSDAW